ncbi:MAG: hypothetical protein HY698_04325 [Deltaproteobacteria bacterium]|nr:hypothetical protein [Deltaproteobacteria bacterium]
MHSRVRTIPATVFFLSVAISATALAKGPEIFPLSQVKPGQKGYGLTVFQGTTPERFEFEVVGVASKMLPRMDIIIVKSTDPKILEVGFARGMSGSPLFIDGKVACAFSYGFSFSKGNIGGCTPIEYMLADAKRPARGPEHTAIASAEEFREHVPSAELVDQGGSLPKTQVPPWLLGPPLPTRAPASDGKMGGMVRAGIPLMMGGLGPSAFEQARRIFEPFGITPEQGIGGGGGGNRGPTQYEMGGAIGAQLARGDVSMVGTGTVSYIDGNTVLAFGHPFFQMGEVYMPAVTAEVHAVVPAYSMAFKMASPLRLLGSLVQDRQASIVVDSAKKTEMIPVRIRVKAPAVDQVFESEILRHRFLSPPLAALMAQNAIQVLAPDLADVTVTIKSKLQVRGFEPLEFVDYYYSADGPAGAVGSARGLRALGPLLFNPFSPVRIDGLEIDVDIVYKASFMEIESIRVPDYELPYGEKTHVDVVMRRFGGAPSIERVPIYIPERLAGSTVKLEIAPGDSVRPDAAPPSSLSDLVALLRKMYPANLLVATLYTPNEGVTLAGKIIPNLPDSALDTVRPITSSRRGDAYRSITRTVFPVTQVVRGKEELILKIKDKQ